MMTLATDENQQAATLACAACARFLDCGDLDLAAVAVTGNAIERAEGSSELAGDCGYLVRYLAALPIEAAAAAERECAVRYDGEIAALHEALSQIDPISDRTARERATLEHLVRLVDHPRTAAQAEFRARYGGLVTFLRGELAAAYGRALARKLAGWDT
jgi:hypothetical protein